jgi:hypothetical protein
MGEDGLPRDDSPFQRAMRPMLIIFGSVGVVLAIVLASAGELGLSVAMLAMSGLDFATLGAIRKIDTLRRDRVRAVTALCFLVLGSLLLFVGVETARRGNSGRAALAIICGLAGISIPAGWVASIVARNRLDRGVGGRASEWIVRMWNG